MIPLKYLGQNFLNGYHVSERICSFLDITEIETILEIGPGTGSITRFLSKLGKRTVAVEMDPRLALNLKEKALENVEIINADILKFRIENYIAEPYSIIGSLPYNISKQIIKNFLELEKPRANELLFVIQKEVAENYTALPPKSTYLANYAQLFADSKILMNINRKKFSPVPKVDSCLIQFKLKKPEENFHKLNKFFRILFSNPRKKILNNIRPLIENSQLNKFKSTVKQIIDLNKRPAEVSFKEMKDLYLMYNTFQNEKQS